MTTLPGPSYTGQCPQTEVSPGAEKETGTNDMVLLKEHGTNGMVPLKESGTDDMVPLNEPGLNGMVLLEEPGSNGMVTNDMVLLKEVSTNGRRQYTLDDNVNLSTDMAVLASKGLQMKWSI